MKFRSLLLVAFSTMVVLAGAALCHGADGWLPRPWKKGSPTRRVLSNTRDVLTPWNNDDDHNEFLEGNRRFFRPDLVADEERNKPRWYRPATWLQEEPEPQHPATVSDWIGLERPGFEQH